MKYKNDRDVPDFYLSSESTEDRVLVYYIDCLGVLRYYV